MKTKIGEMTENVHFESNNRVESSTIMIGVMRPQFRVSTTLKSRAVESLKVGLPNLGMGLC